MFFLLKFSIFIDQLIFGDKIKCFSHLLFWSITICIYLVCNQYKILLFQISNNDLDLLTLFSLVLTIWANFGIYVGFLQFMAGYDNKENGTYLGYQKMDFLTRRNVWSHLTNSWEFFGSLLLSIVLPIMVKLNLLVGNHFQYIFQSVVGFLLVLYIFLLQFSLKVARTTILINKKNDGGLKEVIKLDIENRYNKYFNKLINQKFSYGSMESYFRQVKMELSNIENNADKIIFLKVVYFRIIDDEFIDRFEGFEAKDIDNYKYFIKEKYDLISNIDLEDDELISFAISLFKIDTQIFDKLIKKDTRWIDNDYNFESWGIYNKKFILNVECNFKNKQSLINSYDFRKINNIHIYMFKKLVEMAKNKQTISQLVHLIQEKISQNNIRENYWRTDSPSEVFIFDKTISTPNLRISKSYYEEIERINIFNSSYYSEIKYKSDSNNIYIYFYPNILKIDFHFKDGGKYYIQRNKIRDYYDEYEEKVWNILFAKYRDSDNLSDEFFPNLREPEIILDSFGDSDDILVRDYDNKIYYSKICFNYLTTNFEYIDSNNSQFTNLLKIVKTMSTIYRGAFALYQLLYPENRDWDSSVESYIEILSEALQSIKEERKKIYNDMVSIIIEIENRKGLGREVLEKVFETRDNLVIDDKFLKDFKDIPKLLLIVVQSILSTSQYSFRKVELQKEYEKRDLVKQYIRGLSITPNLFLSRTNYNKPLNSSMSEFLLENMKLLSYYDFGNFPLSSILMFEKLLYWKCYRDDKHDEQEFMINHIREKDEHKLRGYRYHFFGSLLKFLTLKLTEDQDIQYLSIVSDKDFKKDFKFALLNYLKVNQLTLDMYLDEITNELENYDSLRVGIYEKKLIKREVKKIIFKNYISLN